MENEASYIDLLIANFLSGASTDVEKTELREWMNLTSANEKHFEESKRIWDNSHQVFPSAEILSDQIKIKDQIIYQLSNTGQSRTLSLWFYRVASVAALLVMLGIGWYLGNSDNTENKTLCEISTPKGHISKCILADGSEVWLNAGSTLRYEPSLRGKTRAVELDGEAYFKVSKDKDRPFVVNTKFAQVKVLGTVFNMKAYSTDDHVETTLAEGSVEFKLTGNLSKSVELKPGELVVFQKSEQILTTSKVDIYLYTAWKDGKYVFKDAELKDIIDELERLYDVKFHVQNDSLLHIRFRGMFEYDQNIFGALERLELTTNMKYKMEGRNIWLK
jgi:transmembrane sensor